MFSSLIVHLSRPKNEVGNPRPDTQYIVRFSMFMDTHLFTSVYNSVSINMRLLFLYLYTNCNSLFTVYLIVFICPLKTLHTHRIVLKCPDPVSTSPSTKKYSTLYSICKFLIEVYFYLFTLLGMDSVVDIWLNQPSFLEH